MTLTAVGTNEIAGERSDSVTTLPITDSTTLTAATTFVARVKVQTSDGNPGYINVYSTSNEA